MEDDWDVCARTCFKQFFVPHAGMHPMSFAQQRYVVLERYAPALRCGAWNVLREMLLVLGKVLETEAWLRVKLYALGFRKGWIILSPDFSQHMPGSSQRGLEFT